MRGGVVAAVDFDCAGDQLAGDLRGIFFLRSDGGDLGFAHLVVQAVGAQDQHIARLQGEGRGVGRDKHLRPQRANENVAGIGGGDFAGGDQAHLALLVDQRMVLRDLPRLAVADEVAARIADVRDHGLIVAQGAGDERGGHLLAAIFGLKRAIVHRSIGVLDEPRHQADEHGARLRLGKFLGDHRDGGGRGDFAEIEPADSVGNDKKKAVGARLLARCRDKGPHGVFIIGADFAEVACLAELYVQHMRRRMRHLANRIEPRCFYLVNLRLVRKERAGGPLSPASHNEAGERIHPEF